MRKFCSILLAIIMILPLGMWGTIFANANTTPTITIGNVSGFADNTVDVPIVISNNPGIAALSFDISYDSSKINLISATDGAILGTSTATFGNDVSLIPYTLCWDDLSTKNNTGNGTVATLRFKILSGATGTAGITIKLNQGSTFNVDLEDVKFETVNGSVNITAVSLSSIAVKTNPTKTSYFVGDTLNTSGLTLTATYNNGTTKTISSGFTCTPTTLSTAGTQKITVTYSGKTTSFNVTVNSVELSSIAVKTNPTKTSYFVGDTLNTSGLTLTATYNNGTTKTISSGFTCTPTALNTAGTHKITVTYGGKSISFNVTVSQTSLLNISINTKPTRTYWYGIGDPVDISGLTLLATYNNGTTEIIKDGFSYEPKVLSSEGEQTITVTYKDCSATFNVTAFDPHKLEYNTYGGTSTPESQTGKMVTISQEIPERFPDAFSGWQTAGYIGAPPKTYYPGDTLILYEDTTLYAIWSQTRIWENNEATFTIDFPEEEISCFFNVEKDGVYSFCSNGSLDTKVRLYDSDGNLLISDDNNGLDNNFNVVYQLVAGNTYHLIISANSIGEFTLKTETINYVFYTVSYDANGGTGAPESQSTTGAITIPKTIPSKSGYKFLGWSKSSDSTSAQYSPGTILGVNNNFTLYAVWEKESVPPVIEDLPELVIRNPSTTTISYGDAIILHADVTGTLPAGATIKWESSNSNFAMEVSADGTTCKISPNSKGDTTFTVSVVDANGNVISSDEQVMISKAGFFDKIIAFFKKLFGLTKTIPQIYNGIF